MKVTLLVLSIVITFTAPAFAQNAWTEPSRALTPYADVTVTSGAAVVVCPLDPIRKFCNARNMSADTAVRWGDSSVTATRGQQLKAGEPIEINAASAVYMISEGDDVTVSRTAETR